MKINKIQQAALVLFAAFLTAGLLSCGAGKGGESAGEFSGASVTDKTGETDETSPISEAGEKSETKAPAPVEKEGKDTVKVFNVRDYGAKADGYDDSAFIQAAIDACAAAGGGRVYLPAGNYTVKTTLYNKAKVSIVGDGMWTSYLTWKGGADSAIINIANEALWGISIKNLFFTAPGGNKITGILGGSTLKNYNSAIGTFKNLVFSGIYCGIDGSAEPSGVGIFDCMFENIFCSSCTYGLHLYGSGNTVIHPRIATCEAGLVLDYLNGESFDGIHVIGGIFASNVTDILIPSKSGTRPCNFVGTWFEDARRGILNITHPMTRVMNLTFRDCMLNSAADNKNYFLLDASNAAGVVTLDSCTVVNYAGIKPPEDKNSRLAMTNLQVYDAAGTYTLNDRESGAFATAAPGDKTAFVIPHKLKAVPGAVHLTPSTPLSAEGGYYVVADEKYITVHFLTPPSGEIGFFWEVIR